MNLADRYQKLLKKHGLRLTQPRRIVFEFLINAGEPVQLRQILGLQGNWVDRASLYRTVKLYKELGILHEVHRRGGDWLELGEEFSPHHHHITCIDCGTTSVIESHQLESDLRRIARGSGYELLEHQVEISGRCPTCLMLSGQH